MTTTTTRNPWAAAALTLLVPGMGQVYCGALLRGLAFMAAGSIITALLVGAMVLDSNSAGPAWLFVAIGGGLVIPIAALVDSYRLARRTREDYRLKEYNHAWTYLLLFVLSTGGAIAYGLHVRESWLQAFVIPNQSMYPAIRGGDRILVVKERDLSAIPELGEVIVFRNPENRAQNYVKRVAARAGDVVEIRRGDLWLNGEKADLELIEPASVRGRKGTIEGAIYREEVAGGSRRIFLPGEDSRSQNDAEAFTVPPHHVFVLGDNRAGSRDSRHFGPVPIADVLGSVEWITWPGEDFSRLGRFEQ